MVIYNFGLVLLKCVLTIIMYARGRWLGSGEWSPLSQDLLHWPPLKSSHWRRQRATAAIPPAMTSVRDLIVDFHHIRKWRYKKNWEAAIFLHCPVSWTVVLIMCCFYSGPFGERDDQQVFIQKVIPITNKLFVRLSSTGKRYMLKS